MPSKNLKKLLKNNLGFSPIIIVVIFLVLFLISLGIGYFFYSRDPYIVFHNSVAKFQKLENIKNFEASCDISTTVNLGKYFKQTEGYSLQSGIDPSGIMLSIFDDMDREITYSYGGSAKINTENKTLLANTYLKTGDLRLTRMPDLISPDGNFLNVDSFIGVNKEDNFESVYFRINKLPKFFPVLDGRGSFGKVDLISLTNFWTDFSSYYSGVPSPISNRSFSKSIRESIDSGDMPKNILTCDYNTLDFYKKIKIARISKKIFSKIDNLGSVDIDGVRSNKLAFELNSDNDKQIIEGLDEISKIVCKDSSNLDNKKIYDILFTETSLKKLNINYYVDNKTGLPNKLELEFGLNNSTFGDLKIKTSGTLKNINNTSFEKPSQFISVEEYQDKISEISQKISELNNNRYSN